MRSAHRLPKKMRERTSNIIPPKTTKPRRPGTLWLRISKHVLVIKGRKGGGRAFRRIPSQMGEIGVLAVSFLASFLTSSSDLPILASFCLANLRFARRCWGVCACTEGSPWLAPGH